MVYKYFLSSGTAAPAGLHDDQQVLPPLTSNTDSQKSVFFVTKITNGAMVYDFTSQKQYFIYEYSIMYHLYWN